jgi:hypothetical protein
MFGGLGASRSGLYSAPVAPGSYYGSQRLRPGHFCGSTVGKNGSKTPPKGAELTIGLQEVFYYCKEPRRPMAAMCVVCALDECWVCVGCVLGVCWVCVGCVLGVCWVSVG